MGPDMVAPRKPLGGDRSFEFLVEISSRVSHREAAVGYEGLAKPERYFSCIWDLDSEVHSGGFEHYFSSWSGESAWDAENALIAIGAPKAADIVRRACAVFPNGEPPRDRDARQALLAALNESDRALLSELDAEFFKRPDDIDMLLHMYIRKHAPTFGVE